MVDRVFQNQKSAAAIRKGDLSPELVNVLSAVGNELDVYFDVGSGGQPTKAEGGARTGSDRHDHGNAADTKVYVLNSDGSKRYLDFNNADDNALLSRVVQLSVAGGAEGVGAGNDYMGGKTLHIGFGKSGAWGAKGSSANAPEWLKKAYDLGTKTPPMNIPVVATAANAKPGAPIPATLTRGIDMARTKFAANVANTPLPRPRPNDAIAQAYPATSASAAPQPATMSPALQAARTRLAAARQTAPTGNSARDPLGVGASGLAVTPRVPGNYDWTQNVAPTAAEVAVSKSQSPEMDVSRVQAGAIIQDEGVGSLMNPRSVSPGTPNPVKPPPVGLRVPQGPTVDPVGNGASLVDLNTMKQGAPPPVPLPRTARPATQPATSTEAYPTPAAAAPAAPAMVKLASGKMAPVGATNVSGDSVWTVVDNGDGTGKMVKFDPGILKEINSDSVAGGVVRQKVGEGITAGKDAVVTAAKPIIDTVGKTAGDLIGQAGNMLGGLFGGAPAAPKSGSTLAIPATQSGSALAPLGGTRGLQDIHDKNAAVMGYGEIAPIPATMPANLRQGNALPKSTITVKPAAQPAAPKMYQSGGYVYSANPAGGYTKVGKMVNGSPVMSNTGSQPAAAKPAPSGGGSSPSSGIPSGYIDLGNGKIQSPETGGIYYTRNL